MLLLKLVFMYCIRSCTTVATHLTRKTFVNIYSEINSDNDDNDDYHDNEHTAKIGQLFYRNLISLQTIMKDTLSSNHELVKAWFSPTYTPVYLYFEINRDPLLKVLVLG